MDWIWIWERLRTGIELGSERICIWTRLLTAIELGDEEDADGNSRP